MFRSTAHWIRRFGLALCITGACTAHAAPPLTRGAAPHPALKLDSVTKLDLRLPAPADVDGGKSFARFGRNESELQSESLHVSEVETRVGGGVAAMAQRFRREGLPLARLWENHTALVSLGLNSKGKPGIWLVQKIH
jgi:hypothetical protein